MESGIQVPLTRNPGSTARKSESKGSLQCRRSLSFVTRYCSVRGVGTRYCIVNVVRTRDEVLRKSSWQVLPRATRLFSTFAAHFSDFVSLKKLICGKYIRKVKVKPKDFSGCQLSSTRREPNEGMCHPKSNRGVSKVVLANDTRKILSNISASLYEHFSASDFAIRKNRCSSSFVAGQSIFLCVFSCVFSMSF